MSTDGGSNPPPLNVYELAVSSKNLNIVAE